MYPESKSRNDCYISLYSSVRVRACVCVLEIARDFPLGGLNSIFKCAANVNTDVHVCRQDPVPIHLFAETGAARTKVRSTPQHGS